jgi:hypothetical protein
MKLDEALEVLNETSVETLKRAMEIDFITPAEVDAIVKSLEQTIKGLDAASRAIGSGPATKVLRGLSKKKVTSKVGRSNPVDLTLLRDNMVAMRTDYDDSITSVQSDIEDWVSDLKLARRGIK